MKFNVGCELGYQVESPTTLLVNIEAMRLDHQIVVSEALTVTPDSPVERYEAPESGTRYAKITMQPGDVKVRYEAEIDHDPRYFAPETIHEVDPIELPFATLPHIFPSRFCESDQMTQLALSEFGALDPGHERVTAICNWIYERIDYVRGSSDQHTSARATLAQRQGVCRDFAHLGVSLCRALKIPARFVSCYAWQLDPPDFHAVFEAYVGGRWHLFDATRQAALDGLVKIAIARDAAEAAFAQTIGGSAIPDVPKVWIRRLDGPNQTERTTQAISTSDL